MADRVPETSGAGAPAKCLFLSHSGADTDAARELKRRILESPAVRETGLTVWFDKDDLAAGLGWQEQIEAAVTRAATAFAVYVGTNGVINWVEREVRLALARATGAGAIPFVPILAGGLPSGAVAALPAFAQQHQAVRDPLQDATEFAKLIEAILGRAAGAPPRMTDEPFVGLRAMTEREADRFFGREAEVAELVEDLRRNRLVAIVADSGAGKSSLAMAGLAPAFRGGALADPARRGPDDRIWHVVVTRPGGDPLEGLRRGITEAAERMGLSPDARAGLRNRLTLEHASEAAYALRCDLEAGTTETLLIVDQFDELLTETPESARAPFIDFLLKLVAMRSPGGFHVVLTVRVDYFNLCRPYEALYDALQMTERVLRLKRISDAGLEEAVRAPLRMAGFADESDQKALVSATRRDLSDRAGDLALAQMALWTVWRNRGAHGGSLLKAYVDVGGVSGALAQEAERVRVGKLSETERELLPALFVRLVRLGETGGVLRRIAAKDEFDDARRALAEKLASDDYGRLLLVSEGRQAEGVKIEVCHEALITQWPWLQNTLNAAAADLRALDRLMDRASRWSATCNKKREQYLATGAERELFTKLCERREKWLSKTEKSFVINSESNFKNEQCKKTESEILLRNLNDNLSSKARRLRMYLIIVVVMSVCLIGSTLTIFSLAALWAADKARVELKFATKTATMFTIDSFYRTIGAFSPDGRRIVTASKGTVSIWDLVTGNLNSVLISHDVGIRSAAFSPDGRKIVTGSDDHAAQVWDVETRKSILVLSGHTNSVSSAIFSPDGNQIMTISDDNTVKIWDSVRGNIIITLFHQDRVLSANFSPDGKRAITSSLDGNTRLWDIYTGRQIAILRVVLKKHEAQPTGTPLEPQPLRLSQ